MALNRSSQAQAETLVLSANRRHNNMLTTSLRPAGIIGEGDVQSIPNMLNAYRTGKTGFQLGANDNLFDFTYVENVAHAHILASHALLRTHAMLPTVPLSHERVDGEAFFVTNDSPVYFWDMPRLVWRTAGERRGTEHVWRIQKDVGLALATVMEWVFWAMGRTPSLTRRQVRYTSMTRYYNIDKAKNRLGYAPIVGLEEGVGRAVRWFEEQEREREQSANGDGAKKVQ
ncbi:MAG: hypothetical protein L6R40_008802 [Gallowayella cf. fulva]|nr:MAG: hypothetical protein L6R40_008802 [Xanthomendoza cf. fulva]